MQTFQDLIKERESFSEETQSALMQRVKALQGALYSYLVERVIDNLEVDEAGQIKFTIGNARTAGKFSTVWKAYQRQSGGLTGWIVKQLIRLFDLNTKYIREVERVSDSLEAKARKLLLLNLGYDVDKKQIVPDSWLANLTAQDEIKQKVASRINTAIQSKVSLKEFRKQFKDDFLDTNSGLGYLSRYYEQRTFDIFQKTDRAAQEIYAQELKLNWRIYSGTLMEPVKGKTKGTRPFCRARLNNIYSSGEIKKWQNLKFAGRVDPYDPFIDCGSINCRHHWSVISEQMKDTLEKRGRKVDQYNPLPAGQTLTKY